MDKAMEYIDKLAAKLGVAAEHVYGVLVKQAFANGVTNVIFGALVILATIILSIYTAKFVKKHHRNHGMDGVDLLILIAFCLTFIVLPTFGGITSVANGIMALINPEYYAIKEILDTIGGK
ncbi:hypothetical protein [Bacillus sp. FSL W8-0940]|uniref:hypothetical protein n=1 Tax=Bacillus sp. FSL W8-0940 TaxID=2954638 RepID=UPI0030FCEBC9